MNNFKQVKLMQYLKTVTDIMQNKKRYLHVVQYAIKIVNVKNRAKL